MQIALSVSPTAVAAVQPTQGRAPSAGGDWTLFDMTGNGPLAEFFGTSSVRGIGLEMISETKGLLSYASTSGTADEEKGNLVVFNIDANNKITFGTPFVYGSIDMASSSAVGVHLMASGDIMVVYKEATNTWAKGQILNISGDTITGGNGDFPLNSSVPIQNLNSALSPDKTEVLVTEEDNGQDLNMYIVEQSGQTVVQVSGVQDVTGTNDVPYPAWFDDDNITVTYEASNILQKLYSLDPTTRAFTLEDTISITPTTGNTPGVPIVLNDSHTLSVYGNIAGTGFSAGQVVEMLPAGSSAGAQNKYNPEDDGFNTLGTLMTSEIALTYYNVGGVVDQMSISTLTFDIDTKVVTSQVNARVAPQNNPTIGTTGLQRVNDDKVIISVSDAFTERGYLQILNSVNVDNGQSKVTHATGNTPVIWGNVNEDYIDSKLLDTDKTIKVYSDKNDGGKGKAVIETVSGTTPTTQTPFEFSANDVEDLQVQVISASQVIVSYNDITNGEGRAQVLDISGNTITGGNGETTFNASGQADALHMDKISSTEFPVVYEDESNSGFGTAQILTVSGTTVTSNSKFVFLAVTSSEPVVTAITATKLIVGYRQLTGKATLLDVSGTTITGGNNIIVVDEGAGREFNIARIDDDNAVMVSRSVGDLSNRRFARVITADGSTISNAGPGTCPGINGLGNGSLSVLDSGKIVHSWALSLNEAYVSVMTVIQGTLVVTHKALTFNTTGTVTFTSLVDLDGSRMLCNYAVNGIGTSQVFDLSTDLQ